MVREVCENIPHSEKHTNKMEKIERLIDAARDGDLNEVKSIIEIDGLNVNSQLRVNKSSLSFLNSFFLS